MVIFHVISVLKALERGEKTVGAILRISLPAFPTGSSPALGLQSQYSEEDSGVRSMDQ